MNAETAVSEVARQGGVQLGRPGYWLTRFVILRLLGLVYLTAFLVAAHQLVPLIGHEGLLPADRFLGRVARHFGSEAAAFWQLPTVFWWKVTDGFLQMVAWVGVAISGAVLCGYASGLMLLVLWGLYLSILHVGQLWYSYGWEAQLLETGLIAVFLVPFWDGRPFSKSPPSVVVLWVYRWLAFRIMLGAGLIKLRGDVCWRDLTALVFHYETQPVPNPLSRFLHFGPVWFHKLGVFWNHFVELVVPWFGLVRGWTGNVAGVLMVSFMGILIFSGNLSFLNWLTIIPCLACINDGVWRRVLPGWLVERLEVPKESRRPRRVLKICGWAFACLVAVLSVEPVKNLFSARQAMNASFDRLHLVNTYGAFGTVGRERYELVFEGTDSLLPEESAPWREYEFRVKPGSVGRRPAVITPYHYRLDWQIWFAAIPSVHYELGSLPTPQHYPWVAHFVWKLLHNDEGTLGLLAGNPFPEKAPQYVRVLVYRYRFAPVGNPEGAWWTRERVGMWLRPVSLYTPELRQFLEGNDLIERGSF